MGALDESLQQFADTWRDRGWAHPEAMEAVAALLRARQVINGELDRVLEPLGMTFARFEALLLLDTTEEGALPIGKIGERLALHAATITNTVDRLEVGGLIRRVPHPSDRRATLAEITDDGRAVVAECARLLSGARFVMDGLAEIECAQLARLLRRRLSVADATQASAALDSKTTRSAG